MFVSSKTGNQLIGGVEVEMEIENLYYEWSGKKNYKNRDFLPWNDIYGQYDPFVCTCNRQGRLRNVACPEVRLQALRENEVSKFLERKLFNSILDKERFKTLT